MPSQPICPCCRSPQAAQRVAAIVAGGTQRVRVLTADLVPAAGAARTDLAQLLAPPRQPGGGWVAVALLFGLLLLIVPASCMATVLIIGLRGQTFDAAFTSGAAERIFAGVAGVGALVAIAIMASVARLGERRRRAATEQWERQLARWQQSWYCHRCHVVFGAGSAQAVAPEQFGRLLIRSGSAGQRAQRASSRADQAHQPGVVL